MKLSQSEKVGVGFAIAHLAAVALFSAYVCFSGDGQARLLWTIWLPIDFPVSLLVGVGFDTYPSGGYFGALFRSWLPFLVHGVLGTVWWFFIPVFIGKAVGTWPRRRSRDP